MDKHYLSGEKSPSQNLIFSEEEKTTPKTPISKFMFLDL